MKAWPNLKPPGSGNFFGEGLTNRQIVTICLVICNGEEVNVWPMEQQENPKIKEKHPNWFKMKLERRELIRQLSPETAVNVLLACWDYLETGEKPATLSPIESVAFASFMPDMEEAWARYMQRINAKNNGKGESVDIA